MIEKIFFDEVKKEWYRVCPVCQTPTYHSYKYRCNLYNRSKKPCRSCSAKQQWEKSKPIIPASISFDPISNRWKRICPKCKKETSQQSRATAINNALSLCWKCKIATPMSSQTKSKLSEKAIERWKKISFRKKMNGHLHRMRTLQIRGRKVIVSFNPIVCNFLDKVNQEGNLFFRHQKNHPNGEFSCLGYFADGYDEQKNIWFEYDEPHHETNFIKQKDAIRERRLIGKLKGRFIRYSEKHSVFYEVLPNQTYKKIIALI